MNIYVHMIDGTEAWVPIPAREVSAGEYQVLESDTFDPEDTTALLQFIPGDVVRLQEGRAAELVSSSHPDREYWSILYGIVSGQLPRGVESKVRRRIISEIEAGSRPHYPAVIEWATERE